MSGPEELRALVEEMRAGLEGVTPGPWSTLYRANHRETNKTCASIIVAPPHQSHLKELHLGMVGSHPGVSTEQGKRNAAHIARCSPENIAKLLTAAESALSASGAPGAVVKPKGLTEYELQVLLGTSIHGCNMPPDRVFSLDMAWHRLHTIGLIDRPDGLAIITDKGKALVDAILADAPAHPQASSLGWQPIEAYDKERGDIAVLLDWFTYRTDPNKKPNPVRYVGYWSEEYGAWFDDDGMDLDIDPTHFMPLLPVPAAPLPAQQEDER